ncbi:molybdopterin-dependent oxidoreductase [Mesorhizobium hawassense]|uniref:molybdopterin-dependent oxidoreductase n=1 Tax=Mesorhizobium hawassense TaxID=1209954 RepID=UPI00315DB08C
MGGNHPILFRPLVVPGWYGTNSVKWVGSITAADRRAPGPWTTRFYNDTTPNGTWPVWAVAPESVIIRPDPTLPLAAGEAVDVWGWAWGDNPIETVEISHNAGADWQTASVRPRRDRSWQRFELPWTPTKGEHVLMCRCMTSPGSSSPSLAPGTRSTASRSKR